MPPEKKGKKTTAKVPSKKSVKTPTPVHNSGGNGPFYVLIIIILITVIVLLLNKFYEKGKFNIPLLSITDKKSDVVKDKSDSAKDKGDGDKSLISPTDKESDKDKKKDENISKSDDKKADEKISPIDKEVSLYFLKLDEKSEKIYLSTVKRKLPDKQILSLTLEQLIKGPTAYEKGLGYITAVPSHLKIRNIDIKGTTAEIDFNGVIEEGAAGDILLKRVQQIVNTATQFDNVQSIIIKINGQRRKTIGGDGFSIGGPLRR